MRPSFLSLAALSALHLSSAFDFENPFSKYHSEVYCDVASDGSEPVYPLKKFVYDSAQEGCSKLERPYSSSGGHYFNCLPNGPDGFTVTYDVTLLDGRSGTLDQKRCIHLFGNIADECEFYQDTGSNTKDDNFEYTIFINNQGCKDED